MNTVLEPIAPREAARMLGRSLGIKSKGEQIHAKLSKFAVEAAGRSNGMANWQPEREDRWAEEYQTKIYDAQSRAVNLHITNADIRGHNHSRTARVTASGIEFKATPDAAEIGLTPEACVTFSARANRLRKLHSENGGFDASGRGRSEGILQFGAFFTAMIMGGCLVHRVWKPGGNRLIPLALELIPGSRISTPFDMYGSPFVHFGVQYADEYRSEVTGYWVKRVPRTIGNASVQIPEWDFIPIEDASFLELIEPAGFDRSLPNCVAVTRLVFNRGQMFENTVESSRAHSEIYAVLNVSGLSPYDAAADMAETEGGTTADGVPYSFHTIDGTKVMVIGEKDKMDFRNVVTPGPDFVGVDGKYDERICRGLGGRLSEFTRRMDASYSGGMQERQNDIPQVDVMRKNFLDFWRKIHGWTLDAMFMTGSVEMPGYSVATKIYWMQARTMAPAEIPLNPVDHRNAQKLALAMGVANPYMLCEGDGHDYDAVLEGQALAVKARRDKEVKYGLPEGALEPLEKLPEIKSQPVENPDNRDNDGDRGTKAAFKTARISGRLKAVRV